MGDESRFALQDADRTLDRAKTLTDQFKPAEAGAPKLSIAPRQAQELKQFVTVHCDELVRYCEQLKVSDSQLDRQLLTTRRMELEEAVRFIERAFVQPRTSGLESQALEAADWMCVEGFRLFVEDSDERPIGPIVAIDSAQSPAVWAPDASLPIPSLFSTEPRTIDRTKSLAAFPLICLPGHLSRSPEYYPLLSHEVGHAVDNSNQLTSSILEQLPEGLRIKYWRAWMREIVADAVGVTLSGEAFLLALARYLDQLSPLDEISASNAYPGNDLRLALIGACLDQFDQNLTVAGRIPNEEDLGRISRTAKLLLREFRDDVLPFIASSVLNRNEDWADEHRSVTDLANRVASGDNVEWTSSVFRTMPSVIAIAQKIALEQKRNAEVSTFDAFRALHASVKDDQRPEWVGGKTNWVFSEDYLPSLRPTLLGADGRFKVPPLLLMTTYQRIAFVGATNWQLCSAMEKAFEKRGHIPWEEIHLFFASDELLEHVEYGDYDSRAARDESQTEFEEVLRKGHWANKWAIYRFNGPPVFASYWDWHERGGRIHVSPALLGTVIGECPASDHIWHQKTPTDHYRKYVKHLEQLLRPIPATAVVAAGP